MNITIEPINSAQAKVRILIPAAEVAARMDTYFSGLARKAKVPGFRPGKAPKDVVRKIYAADSASDLTERLVSEFTVIAIQEKKLELSMPPRLLATDLPEETKDFQFEVEVDLRPTVPEINLKNLEIEAALPKEVTEEEVQQQLENLREAEAPFLDIKVPREAKNGDYVMIKFEGSVDGVKSPELAAESHALVLGKNEFLPDFEVAVLGMKPGEKKSFDLKFPENYQAEHLRSKTAKFDVEILGIKEKSLPNLDDAFAESVNSEFKTLEDLKKDIRKELEAQRDRMKRTSLRDRIGDKLVEAHPFEISEHQVETMAQSLSEEAHHMMHKMGVEHEENEEHFKALHASSLKKARRDIQLAYLLQKIAKENSIEATEEDVQKRLEEISKRTGFSLTQIKTYYAGKDEDTSLSRMDRLKIDVQDEKSLDYALSQATIKNKGS
jgi:trigger factor